MKRIESLAGKRFGRFMVLNESDRKGGMRRWLCHCDCGNERIVYQKNLLDGNSSSCGCYLREIMTRHGMINTPEHDAWTNMISRCSQQRYAKYYRDRGISVCEEWRESFEPFYSDMGSRPSSLHTLERVDNRKGYEPGNCRWATRAEQARNTRQNVRLTFRGKTQCLAEWVNETGISRSALDKRLKLGWPLELALTSPVSTAKRCSREIHFQ